MPTYNYKCINCNNIFEKDRIVVERDLKTMCPVCGGNSDREFIPITAISFKGSGFYVTDTRVEKENKDVRIEEGNKSIQD